MKIGDLITTYYSGFFILTKIEKRFITQKMIDSYSTYKDKKVGDEYSPLYYFKQEYDINGKLIKETNYVNGEISTKSN